MKRQRIPAGPRGTEEKRLDAKDIQVTLASQLGSEERKLRHPRGRLMR